MQAASLLDFFDESLARFDTRASPLEIFVSQKQQITDNSPQFLGTLL
jgi:hypothetical protein